LVYAVKQKHLNNQKPNLMKMRKILTILFLLILTFGCKEEPPKKTLSELQITACNAADKAQTCDSRLPEVDIVSKEECCDILGKCC
jgi:hypothetical protein